MSVKKPWQGNDASGTPTPPVGCPFAQAILHTNQKRYNLGFSNLLPR
ncbi:hypothetical protein [Nostoc sp.]